MESPSAPACRGRVPWQGLLLAVSLLTFRSPPTTARLTVASISATEGKDVLLLVHSPPENLIGYIWYKGESGDSNHHIASYGIDTQKITPGPAHSGRETIYSNGSLLFQNITLKDTGYYTVHALKRSLQTEAATGQLRVYHGPDAPTISPSDSHYRPGANLRLSCHATSNPPAQYSWLINGRPQQPTQELFITSITANDSGSYTCLAHNSVTGLNRTTVKTITVTEPMGKPSIQARNTNVTECKDTEVMTCLTLGHVDTGSNDTGISIWWFFRDQSLLLTERMKLSWDNSTLITEPVRREDTGGYESEHDYMGSSAETITGIVIGVLVLVAMGTTLGYFLHHRRIRRASDKRGLTEHRPPTSTPGQGPSGASTSPGPLPSPRTAGPIYEDLLHPSTDVYGHISPRANRTS